MAVWDKNTDPKRQAEDLVGYCKVGLQSGYTTFGQISQDKIAEVIRRQGDSLIEIAGGPIPVRGIAMNDERGILNVSASIGSVRQIKAAIEDNDYDQYGRDKYQRVKRKNTFDSREDEEVNETASDKDLPQGDVSSDESAKLRREIRGKKTKKKQELRNLKRNAKKRFIKEESEQEEDDETDQENDEEEKSEPEVHSKRSNHPPKNPTKLNNEPSKSKGEKRTKNDQSNKKLLTLKDNSLARQLDEPSEKNQSVNEAKIVLKADDNDLVHDKKTGKSYQKLPGGGVAELKKMSMRNVDGTLETVYINPKAETSIGKKSNLSKEDYNELKAREQSVKRPSESSNPTIIHKSRKEISQKNEPFKAPKSQNNLTSVASRISLPKSVRKSSRSQFDIQEEESSKESRQISAHKTKHRRPFEFEEGDSDEGEEEYSEDSEEEAIQIRIADKSKSKSFKEVSKPLNSLGDSRGLKHSKTKSQILPNQSIMSRSELNTPLLPHKSGGGLITQKSEVESNDDEDDESNEEKPNGFYDENSVIGKPKFMVGGMSTILQPRVSKLENAKNLKVPVKVGTSSRNNEAYTPRSNIASKFSFPDKNKKSDIDHSVVSRKSSRPKLNLPIGVIDSKPDTESPTPIDIEKFSLNELDKNANESPSMFFMDKKQVKRVGEHSYKGPGNMNKPSARTRLQEYTEETSDPRKRDEVPQFETILPKDFFCDDLIMSFTMILEYFRRFIFMHTALSERMDNLYLGQYQQQMAESISFIDLEYIMEHYNVFITKTELEGLFDFLDEDDKGEISLADLHESLLAYLQFYETITFELYQGIKLLHKAIKQRISLEEFKDYVVDNSERYHIRREHLIDYIENFLELNNPLVNQTMATCGEFIYFDSCYYFNILNYLLFVEHFVGDTLSFEYVNSLHHYHKFKSLIEVKLVYQMYEVFKIPNPDPESLREALQARYNKISDRLPHKVNFRQFRQLLKEMKLTEITVWESMILFKQALESTQSLTNVGFTKHSLLNRGEAFKLLESLATSKRSGDQQTEQSQITHSLLIDKIKKQKNQVAGEKFVYRYDIAVENVDDLNIARCDYCDLSVMYQFPGEAEAIESQIFTYIPDEHSNP